MEKSTVLLFDIDNTLLDFSAGAMQAMEEIFRAAGLPYAPEMFAVFQVENDKLWARIERGELTIAGLRDVRWQTILARLGLEADGAAMEDAFRDRLHESAVPVTGAPEVLARLHGKYRLCAASNGPYAQQVNRLRRAGMLDAFEQLFISGQMGAEKPSRVFFDRCLAQLPGVRPEQCLMIGDSLTADIAGGRAVGMRTCRPRCGHAAAGGLAHHAAGGIVRYSLRKRKKQTALALLSEGGFPICIQKRGCRSLCTRAGFVRFSGSAEDQIFMQTSHARQMTVRRLPMATQSPTRCT